MSAGVLAIREITSAEFDVVWPLFQEILRAGDTYALDAGTSFENARVYWTRPPARAFVAERDGAVVGTSMLRPWQPGHGNHVANAGYMVSPSHRREGIARRLGEHSLAEARAAGFAAMVFSFVVASNEGAIRLWKELGFSVVGRIPNAFRHPSLGMVDALVMHRKL